MCDIISEIGLQLCDCKGNGCGPAENATPPFPHHRGSSQGCEGRAMAEAEVLGSVLRLPPSVRFSIANTAATVHNLTVSSHIHAKLGREGVAWAQFPPPSTLKKSALDSCFKVTFHCCSTNTYHQNTPQGFFS